MCACLRKQYLKKKTETQVLPKNEKIKSCQENNCCLATMMWVVINKHGYDLTTNLIS